MEKIFLMRFIYVYFWDHEMDNTIYVSQEWWTGRLQVRIYED